MNTADFSRKMLSLRKAQGLSQEELADRIGVSRQAVSKWETGQSVPDVEKVILLSEYFGVTVDYMLKGEAPDGNGETLNKSEKHYSAMIAFYIGTAINVIGVAISIAIWYAAYSAYSVGVGTAITCVGTCVFLVGQTAWNSERRKAMELFITLNVWTVLLNPYGIIANLMAASSDGYTYHPAPVPCNMDKYAFWIPYLTICIAVDAAMAMRLQRKGRDSYEEGD